jgi:maltooligosyltrehalose synthase
MALIKLLLSVLGKEGFSLIGFYPPEEPSEEIKKLVVKAFPMSASGGEVVKFKQMNLNFVGCTVRLTGEKPRQGIASLVAITDDEGEVSRVESGMLRVAESISSSDMTSERLKDLLPDVFKFLSAYRIKESEAEGKDKGALEKAVERARGFF